jgi:general secretion pathway protein H
MKPSQGFSLVEILVVLLVIGIALGMASISNYSAEEPLSNSLERLMKEANFATQDSVLSGEAIGLVVQPVGDGWRYYWQRYRDDHWIDEEGALSGRRLDASIQLSLYVEGLPVTIDQKSLDQNSRDQKTSVPLLVYFPSGDSTDVDIVFKKGDERLTLLNDFSGVRLLEDERS